MEALPRVLIVSPDDNKALIRYIVDEALNERRLEIAAEHFAQTYVAHIPRRPAKGLPIGPEAFKQAIGVWHIACSDWHMTIEEMTAEADRVANRFTTRGTHDGPLFGIPPTGNRFVVESVELHRLDDGKVAESWICDDIPGILLQLGIIDMPPLFGPSG